MARHTSECRIDLFTISDKEGCQKKIADIVIQLPVSRSARISSSRPTGFLSPTELEGELQALSEPGSGSSEPFRECANCPLMRAIPAGKFLMGSPASERVTNDENGPDGRPLPVVIARPFAIGVYEVTLSEFEALVRATPGHKIEGNCHVWSGAFWEQRATSTFRKHSFRKHSFAQADTEPVVCVSWHDAIAFLEWVNSRVPGKPYRLLSQADGQHSVLLAADQRLDTFIVAELDLGRTAPSERCNRHLEPVVRAPHRRLAGLQLLAGIGLEAHDWFCRPHRHEAAHELLQPPLAAVVAPRLHLAVENNNRNPIRSGAATYWAQG